MERVLTSNVTNKGQVTIPAKVRKELGICAGSVVEFVSGENGLYHIKPIEQDTLDALKGFISYSGPRVSLEDMHETIVEAALERLDR